MQIDSSSTCTDHCFVHLRLIFDVLLVAGLPAAPVVPARQGRA
jgi:hypothetical protein